jgi:hypothetical protein
MTHSAVLHQEPAKKVFILLKTFFERGNVRTDKTWMTLMERMKAKRKVKEIRPRRILSKVKKRSIKIILSRIIIKPK